MAILALLGWEARGAERCEVGLSLFGGIAESMLCLHTNRNDPEEVGTLRTGKGSRAQKAVGQDEESRGSEGLST